MTKVTILLALTMLLASFAGCAGDDDAPSPVGEWWSGDTMAMHVIEDGTMVDGEGNPGTWSTEGDILIMTIGDGDPVTFNFAVDRSDPGIEWMWLKIVDDDCHAFHTEGISNDEYDDRVAELTPPSFC